MSQYIDTERAPYWGSGGRSVHRLVKIVAGFAIAGGLVAALIAFVGPAGPVAGPDTVVDSASPAPVPHSALDPFELRSGVVPGAAVRTGVVVAQSALDPFEIRSGSSQGQFGIEAETRYPMPEYR